MSHFSNLNIFLILRSTVKEYVIDPLKQIIQWNFEESYVLMNYYSK